MERIDEEMDRRHYLVLVERLLQEGKSEREVERTLRELTAEDRGFLSGLRRLVGASDRKAA